MSEKCTEPRAGRSFRRLLTITNKSEPNHGVNVGYILTEYPDILSACGVLEQPTAGTLEDAVALERSKTLELGSERVENPSVEWRALRNIGRI